MNPTRPYKLFWTQTGTASGVASLKIRRRGKIQSIGFALAGQGGGGTNNSQQVEVSKQVSSAITANDTPPSVLAEACLVFSSSGSSASLTQFAVGLDIPVNVGDVIYAHQVNNGTTPGSTASAVQLYVAED